MSDSLQLHLADMALRHAVQTVAGQAERIAGEIEDGTLDDQGGPDALRLLAALLRTTSPGAAHAGLVHAGLVHAGIVGHA